MFKRVPTTIAAAFRSAIDKIGRSYMELGVFP